MVGPKKMRLPSGYLRPDLIDRTGSPRTDVGDAAVQILLGRGEHVGAGHVVHRNEIPGLLSVAKNRGWSMVPRAIDEKLDHAGIGRTRVLARAIDIEIALTPDDKAVIRRVGQKQFL